MLCNARVVGLLALACMAGCITPERHKEVLTANEVLREQLADVRRTNTDYQAEVQRLEAEVRRMQPLIKDAAFLKAQKAKVAALLARFQGRGGMPTGVETVSTKDGLALRVEGQILFASGSAELSNSGKDTLRQLVSAVREHPGEVRVEGHTDTDPIKHSKWKNNTELSVGRALSVRNFLVTAGVPGPKASVAGYGEFRPVDPADKARNRRVEIVLLR